jgi:hypothetical protein
VTLQNTFEHTFRQRLLDLLFGQWAILGLPFSNRGPLNEVIDPEALVCCSLEFLPTEPRLAEAVVEWVRSNESYVVRQRIYKQLVGTDPRAIIWEAVDGRARNARGQVETPTGICHGLASPAEAVEFARSLRSRLKIQRHSPGLRIGRKLEGTGTLLLRARDLLGQDIRHFLLVYLLALPHGGKLREVQSWSGHAYRSLSEAADRWKAGGIVSMQAGFCRLLSPEPFRTLLKVRSERIVLVNWLTVFETSVRLLRDLAQARWKGFAGDNPIPTTFRREAEEKLESASPSATTLGTSVGKLLQTFPKRVA